MAVSKSRSSDFSVLPAGARQFMRNKVLEIAGLGVLGIVFAIAVALMTWSIKDPSLNHATAAQPTNLLGFPGAVIADLMMQLFGLGTIGLLFPICVWGGKLLSHSTVPRFRKRLFVWSLAGLLTSGFLASFSVPASWPLPTGLGGVCGDFVAAPFFAAMGRFVDPVVIRLVSGTILGAFATVAMVYATSLTIRQITMPLRLFGEEGAELAIRGIGGLIHLGLSFKAMLARKVRHSADRARTIVERRASPQFDDDDDDAPVDVRDTDQPTDGDRPTSRWTIADLAQGLARQFKSDNDATPAQRIEPGFQNDSPGQPYFDDPGDPHPRHADHHEPGPGDFEEEPAPVPSVRVSQAAAPIKQGKRVRKDAQPPLSFSDDQEYELPPLTLLSAPKSRGARKNTSMSDEALEQNARMLETVLEDFGVRGEIINVRPGPVVTLYELEPAPGIKSSRVIGLADDIARSMSAISARVAVVPGRNVIGIELPNAEREMVYLRELLASEDYESTGYDLSLALGKNIGGEPIISDLARMPHLLIAGTTGSGKSVGINTMILSLLFRLPPDKCKLIMIDPKMLELSVYDGIPHLLSPVVTDPKKAVVALKWTVKEMEDRYRKMSKVGVRNIDGFNARVEQAIAKGETIVRTVQTGFDKETGQPIYEQEEMDLEPMPYIVVIVDEMADLMMVAGKDIEGTIQRLAQMARAAGIHMITATQRPSVDVITGTIKANFPTRISFQVTSKIDSRTILGEMGAEQLLGQGDMLYMAGGGRISRVHGPFVSDQEVEKVVKFLKKQGIPKYLEAVTEEPEDGSYELPGMASGDDSDSEDLYDRAVAIVGRDKKASTSYIQRRLSIGYNRAATIIERMENEGVVGPANHAGKREILIGEPGDGVNA